MKDKRSGGFWCLNRDMVFLVHTLNPENDRLFTQYTNLGYMLLFWITAYITV